MATNALEDSRAVPSAGELVGRRVPEHVRVGWGGVGYGISRYREQFLYGRNERRTRSSRPYWRIIRFHPKGARSRREPRQLASAVGDRAPRASPQTD